MNTWSNICHWVKMHLTVEYMQIPNSFYMHHIKRQNYKILIVIFTLAEFC